MNSGREDMLVENVNHMAGNGMYHWWQRNNYAQRTEVHCCKTDRLCETMACGLMCSAVGNDPYGSAGFNPMLTIVSHFARDAVHNPSNREYNPCHYEE